MARAAREQYGDVLPQGVLNDEEYKIYERMYGPPMTEEEAQILEDEGFVQTEAERDALFREGQDGELEEVEYARLRKEDQEHEEEYQDDEFVEEDTEDAAFDDVVLGNERTYTEAVPNKITSKQRLAAEKGNRDDDQLQRDISAALAASARTIPPRDNTSADEAAQLIEDMQDEFDLEDDEGQYNEGETVRTHPFTQANRWATSPSTIHIPHEIATPVSALLANLPNKHIDEAASRIFGGPALPYSTGSPASAKIMPQKPIPLGPGQSKMSEMEADVYLAAVMPGAYATSMSVLVEVRKRLGTSWIEGLLNKDGGPRILDAGAAGAGVIAWREVLKAEWARMHNTESVVPVDGDAAPAGTAPPPPPLGKATVLASSGPLLQRASLLLENTTFLPRLPDYVHATVDPNAEQKQYDIIIAPYNLWHLTETYERKQRVQNLWSLLDPNGGVLILLEKGVPRGFEVIADARSYLLKELMDIGAAEPNDILNTPASSSTLGTKKTPARVLAPCTTHSKCPMYLVPGISRQRKDWCHFSARFFRPAYLQRIMSGKDRNHEDVMFSYVAVQKGVRSDTQPLNHGETLKAKEAQTTDRAFRGFEIGDEDVNQEGLPNPLALPRLILPPLKKPGHVLLDVCTPQGTLERWSVPRSHGKVAFRDARKSKWGDLWALGARQRSEKRVRLGREHMERGIGVGRGMQSVREERVEEERRGKAGVGRKAMGGVKDVKGRSRPSVEGEEVEEGEQSAKKKRNEKQREQKARGREKARTRRRQETEELIGSRRRVVD